MDVPSIPDAGWILDRLPLIAYFGEDDAENTMRVISGVEREVFGHPVKDILNKTNFLNRTFLGDDDYKVVLAHRELVWMGHSPVISRFEIPNTAGDLVPCLLISQGLYSNDRRIGISGVVCDLTTLHVLQGPKGILSKGMRELNWNQRAEIPGVYDDKWLAGALPVVLLVTDNDADYTIRRVTGSLERIVGHGLPADIEARKLRGWSTIDPGHMDFACGVREHALQARACVVHRLSFVHRNGQRVPILGIVLPYFPSDASECVFLEALMDITDVPDFQGPPGVVAFG
jgi:hypothetical protein